MSKHRTNLAADVQPNGTRCPTLSGGNYATAADPHSPPTFLSPNFERVPAELKALKNWVLWVPICKGAKYTKRPIQPSGYGANVTNPNHWSSFEDVKQAYERAVQRGYIEFKGKTAQRIPIGGVGFVFDGQIDANGLVLAGVDFDKVISGNEIASLAQERIKRLGSYTEQSVSGSGLHMIVKARPLERGVAYDGVEMYTSGRFFTMTGRAPENSHIASAPDEFAALAEELRASSSAGTDNAPPAESKQTPETTTNFWLSQLLPNEQSEVVRCAALHVAKHTKFFELTCNGGNYQEYLKLALAIVRSGVSDAEDIFVEAASLAKGADAEQKLREFFQSCAKAEQRADGITVGTLIHAASQCGVDFKRWKDVAVERHPNAAIFVPGNEQVCRQLLGREVVADPCTYTLGDPTGPLVILRVPNQATLPPETRWEGDLPGTTLALGPDIMERAERIVWMRKGQSGLYRSRPPRDFVNDYLTANVGPIWRTALEGHCTGGAVPRQIADFRSSTQSVSRSCAQSGGTRLVIPIFKVPVR
jgi:hypothetical protein